MVTSGLWKAAKICWDRLRWKNWQFIYITERCWCQLMHKCPKAHQTTSMLCFVLSYYVAPRVGQSSHFFKLFPDPALPFASPANCTWPCNDVQWDTWAAERLNYHKPPYQDWGKDAKTWLDKFAYDSSCQWLYNGSTSSRCFSRKWFWD